MLEKRINKLYKKRSSLVEDIQILKGLLIKQNNDKEQFNTYYKILKIKQKIIKLDLKINEEERKLYEKNNNIGSY